MTEDPDARSLARDMIEVHGAEASVVARGNARTAALAGQPDRARSWIRVLAMIQRHQANAASARRSAGDPPSAISATIDAQGQT
jgi:hypothetical protein